MFRERKQLTILSAEDALPGRGTPMPLPERHEVFGTPLDGPFPGAEAALFALGCFWGAERLFWQAPGVVSTAVGYSAGHTPHPTYEEVCSGLTGHTEVVRVMFDPERTAYARLLELFWEGHDPTQGMRQGNDIGTQYRSGIYPMSELQAQEASIGRDAYQRALSSAGYGTITTEIVPSSAFYFAEAYHQQYLAKNPAGYCGLGGISVRCPGL